MIHNNDGNVGPKFLPNGRQNYGPREKAGPNYGTAKHLFCKLTAKNLNFPQINGRVMDENEN